MLLLQAFAEGLKAPAPAHVGAVLTLAHFLDHMYYKRPAKRVEASPWYEAATAMVQVQLDALFEQAPKVMYCAFCSHFSCISLRKSKKINPCFLRFAQDVDLSVMLSITAFPDIAYCKQLPNLHLTTLTRSGSLRLGLLLHRAVLANVAFRAFRVERATNLVQLHSL